MMPQTRKKNIKRHKPADMTSSRIAVAAFVVIAILVAWLANAAHNNSSDDIRPEYDDLTAVITRPDLPEELLSYEGFTVSFNPVTHQPNWVAWELLGSETTGESERDNFAADPQVVAGAVPADYTRSGYDRGHMAPAGDMKWSPLAMQQSCYMTNICPQAPDLNRGAWKKLEEKCRQRAAADSAIIIVCGPVFNKGEGYETIGSTGVAVPRSFFKVILSPYANPPRAIGFIMPNKYVSGGMQACAVSVDSIESITGHDFFSALEDDLENRLESQYNFNEFSSIRRATKSHKQTND